MKAIFFLRRKMLFLFFLLSAAFPLRAQTFADGSGHSSSNIAAGLLMPDLDDLNNHLEATYNRPFFPKALYTGGLLFRGPTVSKPGQSYDSHMHLLFVLPEKVQVHDSLSFQLSGWQFSYGLYGKDLLWFTKYVDLVVSPGLVFGKFTIKRKDDDRRSRYANPIVAAKAAAELRFRFGKFSFGGRGEYLYDITDPKWKRKNGLMPVLPGTYYRGPQLLAFLGWTLGLNTKKPEEQLPPDTDL